MLTTRPTRRSSYLITLLITSELFPFLFDSVNTIISWCSLLSSPMISNIVFIMPLIFQAPSRIISFLYFCFLLLPSGCIIPLDFLTFSVLWWTGTCWLTLKLEDQTILDQRTLPLAFAEKWLTKDGSICAANSCYYSVQTLLPSRLLSKIWKLQYMKH